LTAGKTTRAAREGRALNCRAAQGIDDREARRRREAERRGVAILFEALYLNNGFFNVVDYECGGPGLELPQIS
jgi:hypothetical protein